MITYKIATIPGDGIGKEVVPEGIRVLDAVGRKHNIRFQFDIFDWSCETYKKTGQMMPEDGIYQTSEHDAIYLGAVGFPGVPDHISLWGLLIPFRREFQQYVNLRPVRLFKGVPSPLANRKPGDIDFYVVRENVEGEYSEIGGKLYAGTNEELVTQQSTFTRKGVDRILRYAFELAEKRPSKHLTSATKSNGIIHTMPYWDERVVEMQKKFPGIRVDKLSIILAAEVPIDILSETSTLFCIKVILTDILLGASEVGVIVNDISSRDVALATETEKIGATENVLAPLD